MLFQRTVFLSIFLGYSSLAFAVVDTVGLPAATTSDLVKIIKNNKSTVIFELQAGQCEDCKALNSNLKQFAKKSKEKIQIFQINLATNPEVADWFRSKAIPQLLVFDHQKLVHNSIGTRSEEEIGSLLANLPKNEIPLHLTKEESYLDLGADLLDRQLQEATKDFEGKLDLLTHKIAVDLNFLELDLGTINPHGALNFHNSICTYVVKNLQNDLSRLKEDLRKGSIARSYAPQVDSIQIKIELLNDQICKVSTLSYLVLPLQKVMEIVDHVSVEDLHEAISALKTKKNKDEAAVKEQLNLLKNPEAVDEPLVQELPAPFLANPKYSPGGESTATSADNPGTSL